MYGERKGTAWEREEKDTEGRRLGVWVAARLTPLAGMISPFRAAVWYGMYRVYNTVL